MIHVLFVCTGNTCRSPMAEVLFNHILSLDQSLHGRIDVSSAGISAHNGDPASPDSIEVLSKNFGLDLTRHQARCASKKIIDASDLILTMTQEHKEALTSLYPNTMSKVFTLIEYVQKAKFDMLSLDYSGSLDIADPYGQTLPIYAQCANKIFNILLELKTVYEKQF